LSLRGLKVLDVGSGGGLLSEALARLGAQVVGLEPGDEARKVAEDHAKMLWTKRQVFILCNISKSWKYVYIIIF